MGKIRKSLLSVVCVCLLSTVAPAIFAAGTAAAREKFPSKPITFIIPVTPGGGFDTFARMLVPYLQKYLPGNPNIIVKNTPGGEWNIGIKKMYWSKPDGYTIGILNLPANAVNQILGTVNYDLNKITWLGNISEVTYVTCISLKCKYRTLQELQKAPEVTSGVVGLASTAGLGTIIAAQRMGIKMKPIPHDGSTEAILAAIRGDVDWVQFPISTLKKYIVDSKDLIPVWVYSKKRIPQIPDVPTVGELGYPDLANIVTMYRPVGAPPRVPKAVAKVWDDAFWKATNDAEFQKKMIAADEPASPMTPQETAEMVSNAVKEVAKYKALILKYRK
jgi:tripartite-type tricarboxylate transporter receptor subunit TctC